MTLRELKDKHPRAFEALLDFDLDTLDLTVSAVDTQVIISTFADTHYRWRDEDGEWEELGHYPDGSES